MDRALKERTTGAIVLVIFAVLVVPVFLDGPADEAGTVTEPVTLPGQNGQATSRQTIVLERDREEPVPVPVADTEGAAAASRPATALQPGTGSDTAEKAPPPASDKTTAGAVARSAPEPAEKTAPERDAAGAALWAVQLGSFSERNNAERLAADLRAEGYAAFLSKLDTGSRELHRVRIGPQKNREAAEDVAASLASAGHPGQVVPHP